VTLAAGRRGRAARRWQPARSAGGGGAAAVAADVPGAPHRLGRAARPHRLARLPGCRRSRLRTPRGARRLRSAGSAASKTAGPSAALKAIGLDDRTGGLRFSLSRDTTDADVDGAVTALAAAAAEIAAGLPRR
jgi:hypothetical protein